MPFPAARSVVKTKLFFRKGGGQTGMLVVSLGGVNSDVWSRFGSSGQNAKIWSRRGLVLGSVVRLIPNF